MGEEDEEEDDEDDEEDDEDEENDEDEFGMPGHGAGIPPGLAEMMRSMQMQEGGPGGMGAHGGLPPGFMEMMMAQMGPHAFAGMMAGLDEEAEDDDGNEKRLEKKIALLKKRIRADKRKLKECEEKLEGLEALHRAALPQESAGSGDMPAAAMQQVTLLLPS